MIHSDKMYSDYYDKSTPRVSAETAAKHILKKIEEILREKEYLQIAIDGRCASGKTTLAGRLRSLCGCNVISMDSFFLRPEQRTVERLQEPGGNVDYERFIEEVLTPLKVRRPFSYRPFDCRSQMLKAPVPVIPGPVTVVEGSYSLNPLLAESYDLKVFLTVDPEEQLQRIQLRNGNMLPAFRDKWIPLEEHYFAKCRIEEGCDLHYYITVDGKNLYVS